MKSSASLHVKDNAPVKSPRRLHIPDEASMLKFGREFAASLDFAKPIVIELIGDVGTGKTTFTRGLAEGLGIKTPITSPSFTISKSYAFESPTGTPRTLTHYDFYRLGDPGIMAEDLTEKMNSQDLVVIEWSDSVKNLLPKDHSTITFTIQEDDSREVCLA